jgi:hypothetical protein
MPQTQVRGCPKARGLLGITLLAGGHLPRRPDRQFQRPTQCGQVGIPWAAIIGLPKVDAAGTDSDLLGNLSYR